MRQQPYGAAAVIRRLLLGLGAVVIVLTTACTAPTESTSTPTPFPGDGLPAEAGGTPVDAAVAATCAGVSILKTTVDNAQADLASGSISDAQYAALINATATGFESLLTMGASQRGLRSEIQAVVDVFGAPGAPEQPRFDPLGEFGALMVPIRAACEANRSEVVSYATSGG